MGEQDERDEREELSKHDLEYEDDHNEGEDFNEVEGRMGQRIKFDSLKARNAARGEASML
jgi:hypothetical protein